VDGLIGVDAAHIRWHAHGGPDEVPNGLALCALHHRLFDHGSITVREDMRARVSRALAVNSARDLCENLDGQAVRLPGDAQFYPSREHLRWHHAQFFQGQIWWRAKTRHLQRRISSAAPLLPSDATAADLFVWCEQASQSSRRLLSA
jgi:HNH endonuclease